MPQFTCRDAARFRSAIRRAGLSKTVLKSGISFCGDAVGSRFRVANSEIIVDLEVASPDQPFDWTFPLDLLDECGGRTDDVVLIRPIADQRLQASWTVKGFAHVKNTTLLESSQPQPTSLDVWSDHPIGIWKALGRAVSCTSKDATRYAMNCLQLDGEKHHVAATDGSHLLIEGGIAFPWQDAVLIPANKMLGCRDIDEGTSVRITRTDDWIVVQNGPWTIWNRILKDARFPKIDQMVGNVGFGATHLVLDERDATFLTTALPNLPGDELQHRPLTLDLNGHIAVRAKSELGEPPTELILERSHYTGEPLRLSMNRRFLEQAVRFGFRDLRFPNDSQPAVAATGERSYVWALINAESVILDAPDAIRISSTQMHGDRAAIRPHPIAIAGPDNVPFPSPTPNIMQKPVKPDIVKPNVVKTGETTTRKPLDTLLEMETTLRTALQQTREAITALRRQKKQTKLMQATLNGLKQLQVSA